MRGVMFTECLVYHKADTQGDWTHESKVYVCVCACVCARICMTEYIFNWQPSVKIFVHVCVLLHNCLPSSSQSLIL